MLKKISYIIISAFTFFSCSIENDIPYPIVDGSITDLEVENQIAANGSSDSKAVIDKNKRTVSLVVDDGVDIRKLRITKLTVTNDAVISIDTTLCNNPSKFPTNGFESLDELMLSADTRADFSNPVKLTLTTYQNYEWTINVQQYIERVVNVENQVDAIIDEINKNVVIYVAEDQDLSKIKVTEFNLAGKHGTVNPDPTEVEYYDFSMPQTFTVTHSWEDVGTEWKVYVYHSDGPVTAELNVFVRTTSADISGKVQSGKTPIVEIKKSSESEWITVQESSVNVSGTSFSAKVSGLSPETQYECKISVDGNEISSSSFTTVSATPLTNGSLDDWHNIDKLWNPWKEGEQSFWDTGNKGATTISDSNSIPTDDTCNGSGKAASLESKYLVLKFAAGNLFTGSYVKTDGTNGVLSFGRPFTAFPSKLRFNYKYISMAIDKIGEDAFQYLKGRPDSCHVYIALTDWDEPLEIRTRPAERQLFDKNDSKVIAYGEFIQGSTTSSYQQKEIVLNYKYDNRTPKYIVIVASASKYGDYFTGGVGSKLWLDNFELIYE